MGNLGMPELLMIMVLALLLFGPKKLPEIGKQVGKALGEFKRASNDLKRTIEDEMERASSAVKIDDPPAGEDKTAAAVAAVEHPAPALAPADGTIARPAGTAAATTAETTKTPAP
jgi:TatA/E family protein of Tat protein translocase